MPSNPRKARTAVAKQETPEPADNDRPQKVAARKSPKLQELAIRIASAVVLIPVVLIVIAMPLGWMPFSRPWPFLVMLSVGVALLCTEWGLMSAPATSGRMAIAVGTATLAAVFVAYLSHPVLAFLILAFGALCAGLYAYRLKGNWLDAAYGTLYIGIPAIVVIWLRDTHNGRDWVFFAFLIAWASDSAAYIVGKLVGGPKLWRRYSPNKTWSGFAGGMIAGMLTAATLADVTHLLAHDTSAMVVGLIVALSTMAGDLWESALKRRFGVKDAGALIPGHGGLLDRVDGLMFAIVALGIVRMLVFFGTEL
ncbi:MAG: phosphatidate cytidylyltransferase [Asticcacaulis sp.]|nr:phosphatidate cytidylyltransferase [Asticcacaulis sp.]